MQTIAEQIHLPWRNAFEVVLQGIRIRLGRSLVTLSGVALGTAFLMSLLAAGTLRESVRDEALVRDEVTRMQNFLRIETGPFEGRRFAQLPLGEPNAVETRLLASIGKVTPVPRLEAGGKADAILLIGEPAPGAALQPLPEGALVALTRQAQGPLAPEAFQLDRELTTEELAQMESTARKAAARKVWIVVIALLVTVIGICNSLLMSVTERFREIGTMKCLGARSSFIRRLFFIESGLIGTLGSLAGAIGGLLFALFLYGLTYGFGTVFGSLLIGPLSLQFLITWGAGLVLAILAAIYPANRAAAMVPATALRSNI